YSSQQQEHILGMPTSDTGSIFIDNCKVPRENLMGAAGKGLSIAYSGLMSGRLSVAAGCLGVIEDCIYEAVAFSKQRIQHGKTIAKHQLVQDRKSTRLNSSHVKSSYAVFCSKKKTLRAND